MADEETPEVEPTEETAAAAEAEAVESSDETPAAEAPEEAAEPEEKLHPKEARKRARSRSAEPAKATRTNEDRQAERVAVRKAKAVARKRRRDQEKAKKTEKGEGTPPAEKVAGNPQVRRGTVVSAKPDKTITVRIDTSRRHRKYEKIVRSSTTLHVHDETNDANEGDTVQVIECRPLSRLKRWKLVEVLERAK
ncbi:MAG: 30S ribosomal protein S17 [Solirubrobacteraceae bacterium]|nr:30S ribosomal protein S17 [Solirubrobacteraceae bacterium]